MRKLVVRTARAIRKKARNLGDLTYQRRLDGTKTKTGDLLLRAAAKGLSLIVEPKRKIGVRMKTPPYTLGDIEHERRKYGKQ